MALSTPILLYKPSPLSLPKAFSSSPAETIKRYLSLSLPSRAAAGYLLLSFLSPSFCLFQLHHGSTITQYVLLHLACYTKHTIFRSVPIVAQVKFLFFSEGEGCSLSRTRSTFVCLSVDTWCCPSVACCDSVVTNTSVQISP